MMDDQFQKNAIKSRRQKLLEQMMAQSEPQGLKYDSGEPVTLGSAVDQFTGAPLRAGLGKMAGMDVSDYDLFGDPAKAPQGKQIAQSLGVPDEIEEPDMSDIPDEAVNPAMFSAMGRPQQANISPSGLLGGAIDMTDATNLVPQAKMGKFAGLLGSVVDLGKFRKSGVIAEPTTKKVLTPKGYHGRFPKEQHELVEDLDLPVISPDQASTKRLSVAENRRLGKEAPAPTHQDFLYNSDRFDEIPGEEIAESYIEGYLKEKLSTASNSDEILTFAKKFQGSDNPYAAPNFGKTTTAIANYKVPVTGKVGEAGASLKYGNDPFGWHDQHLLAGKKVLSDHLKANKPININTSSDLIAKDDYLELIPPGSSVTFMSPGKDPAIARTLFPSSPSDKRLQVAADVLKERGIKVKIEYPTEEIVRQYSDLKKYGAKESEISEIVAKLRGPQVIEGGASANVLDRKSRLVKKQTRKPKLGLLPGGDE